MGHRSSKENIKIDYVKIAYNKISRQTVNQLNIFLYWNEMLCKLLARSGTCNFSDLMPKVDNLCGGRRVSNPHPYLNASTSVSAPLVKHFTHEKVFSVNKCEGWAELCKKLSPMQKCTRKPHKNKSNWGDGSWDWKGAGLGSGSGLSG